MRLQDKIEGQKITKQPQGGGWLNTFGRAGTKTPDELPLAHHSGFVETDERPVVFDHQKVKP